MDDIVERLQSPEQKLLAELPDKKAQIQAALSKCCGLPFALISSDTHPKLMGIWCDNGLAGVGQVAIVTREFHEGQAEALCILANGATAIPTLIDEIEALRARVETQADWIETAIDQMADCESEIEALRAERDWWQGAAKALAEREADYRHNHDVHGRGDMKTGRAWDLMRRQGDRIRARQALQGET